jgi:hypothetical protein
VLKLLLVAALVAGLVYTVFWAIERRRAAGRSQTQHPSRRPLRKPPPRVVAPDDDEDFLRDLDRKRRRQEDEPG